MKNILIPTDFSDNANQAVLFAIQLANQIDAKLHFLHTIQTKAAMDLPKADFDSLKDENKKLSVEKLKQNIHQICQNCEVELSEDKVKYIVKESIFVIESIIEVAETYQIDFIVMGTQGASGLKKILLGSNTSNVMQKAPCPVLAVPMDSNYAKIEQIAYASELYEVEKEIQKMIEYVRYFDASLEIFHVMPVYPQKINIKELNNRQFIADLRQKFQWEKINLHFVNTEKDNDLEAGINFFLNSYKPDMLVMFTQKRNWFDKIFNTSKTESFATHAHIPLLALKKS